LGAAFAGAPGEGVAAFTGGTIGSTCCAAGACATAVVPCAKAVPAHAPSAITAARARALDIDLWFMLPFPPLPRVVRTGVSLITYSTIGGN
jgi:hypothetical protein